MRQIQIAKVSRTNSRRQQDALLPLDPRDPDIVRAKQLQREGKARPSARALPPDEADT